MVRRSYISTAFLIKFLYSDNIYIYIYILLITVMLIKQF